MGRTAKMDEVVPWGAFVSARRDSRRYYFTSLEEVEQKLRGKGPTDCAKRARMLGDGALEFALLNPIPDAEIARSFGNEVRARELEASENPTHSFCVDRRMRPEPTYELFNFEYRECERPMWAWIRTLWGYTPVPEYIPRVKSMHEELSMETLLLRLQQAINEHEYVPPNTHRPLDVALKKGEPRPLFAGGWTEDPPKLDDAVSDADIYTLSLNLLTCEDVDELTQREGGDRVFTQCRLNKKLDILASALDNFLSKKTTYNTALWKRALWGDDPPSDEIIEKAADAHKLIEEYKKTKRLLDTKFSWDDFATKQQPALFAKFPEATEDKLNDELLLVDVYKGVEGDDDYLKNLSRFLHERHEVKCAKRDYGAWVCGEEVLGINPDVDAPPKPRPKYAEFGSIPDRLKILGQNLTKLAPFRSDAAALFSAAVHFESAFKKWTEVNVKVKEALEKRQKQQVVEYWESERVRALRQHLASLREEAREHLDMRVRRYFAANAAVDGRFAFRWYDPARCPAPCVCKGKQDVVVDLLDPDEITLKDSTEQHECALQRWASPSDLEVWKQLNSKWRIKRSSAATSKRWARELLTLKGYGHDPSLIEFYDQLPDLQLYLHFCSTPVPRIVTTVDNADAFPSCEFLGKCVAPPEKMGVLDTFPHEKDVDVYFAKIWVFAKDVGTAPLVYYANGSTPNTVKFSLVPTSEFTNIMESYDKAFLMSIRFGVDIPKTSLKKGTSVPNFKGGS